MREIQAKLDELGVPREQYEDIIQIGSFTSDVQWNHFLAIAISKVAKVKLNDTIKLFLLQLLLILISFSIRI